MKFYGEINDHKLVKINKDPSKLYINIVYLHTKTNANVSKMSSILLNEMPWCEIHHYN